MTALTFAVLALATARLTRLVVDDVFPPVAAARERFARRGPLSAYLVGCYWCVSVYVSAVVVAVAVAAGTSVPLPGLVALALSCLAGTFGMILDMLETATDAWLDRVDR